MNIDKIERLAAGVMKCSTWEQRKSRAGQYLHSLNDSLEKSESFVRFLDLLAQKDILTAACVSGKEGRHIVAPYLNKSPNNTDISFIECCLFMDFNKDLVDFMKRRIEQITLADVRQIMTDIREKTGDILLLRFLRVLNSIDYQEDYIDDIFLDCPIDTPEFQQEERKFCQELFERQNYLVLYDYLATRERINEIAEILRRSKKEIEEILRQNLNLGSVLLLVYDKGKNTCAHFENLIETLRRADMNKKMADICIFICCLNACIILDEPSEFIKTTFRNLKCDSEYLLRYRKYIGHDEITCFKKFLAADTRTNSSENKSLLNFLELIGDNNTFCNNFSGKKSMKAIVSKNKKYLRDNKNFAKGLKDSRYSAEEKEFIRNNTHLRMYSGEF